MSEPWTLSRFNILIWLLSYLFVNFFDLQMSLRIVTVIIIFGTKTPNPLDLLRTPRSLSSILMRRYHNWTNSFCVDINIPTLLTWTEVDSASRGLLRHILPQDTLLISLQLLTLRLHFKSFRLVVSIAFFGVLRFINCYFYRMTDGLTNKRGQSSLLLTLSMWVL